MLKIISDPFKMLEKKKIGCKFNNSNQGWLSHRNRNRIVPFFSKKSHLQIASKPTKNRICYRIS